MTEASKLSTEVSDLSNLSERLAKTNLADSSEGMSYLDTLPRRVVTTWIPLSLILIVLLFPFYWMVLTAIKPDAQLIDMNTYNPFWVVEPTFKHIHKLLFETRYPLWLWNTMYVSVLATFVSLVASVMAAYAIVRLRFRGAELTAASSFSPISCRRRSCSFRWPPSCRAYGLFDSPMALVLVYPTILIPLLDLAADGLFQRPSPTSSRNAH